MLGLISVIWILYAWLHLLPLVTGDVGLAGCNADSATLTKVSIVLNTPAEASCIDAAYRRGVVETVIQQLLTFMLILCFCRAIFTDPGSVPNEPEWLPEAQSSSRGPEEIGPEAEGGKIKKMPRPHEVKHTGARRFCKWCNRFKPDRSHHCRVCRSCILRMDHHCPWIANCVGFRNHKYFFLLVLYSLLDCTFVIATVSESLHRSLVQETQFAHRFLLVFCMTLAAMMGVLLLLFFVFHSWLMLKATTTIEFCEKTYRHSGCSHRGSTKSIYDRGTMDNMKNVLGSNVLLWLLPTSPPEGDGLSFKIFEDFDDDSDTETTALLSKKRQQGGSAKADDMAGSGSTYQATSADDIKSADATGAAKPSVSSTGVGESIVASGSPVAGGEAAPEVTAGEASIS